MAGVYCVFLQFYLLSGLQLNASKSELFVVGVPQEELAFMAICTGFKVGRLPVRYLGVPLVSRKLSRSNCAALTNRILDKIQGWSTKHLSYIGEGYLWIAWVSEYVLKGSQPEIACLLLGFQLILVTFSIWILQRDVITFSLSVVFQGRCGSQFCVFAPFIGL
ncbi:hypothetical protein J1N35_019578 [Gossypium stocksii]|uniref:Reverse transcriptase domain-containing protein n=1 Tax=Gossypium stocksii TaxID=47602 RepID=A0A9D4A8C6_9ROSI|nr:hypothetical protein J1N35_019578 [Gossypium stocksii]